MKNYIDADQKYVSATILYAKNYSETDSTLILYHDAECVKPVSDEELVELFKQTRILVRAMNADDPTMVLYLGVISIGNIYSTNRNRFNAIAFIDNDELSTVRLYTSSYTPPEGE